jgi:hypothetical protein
VSYNDAFWSETISGMQRREMENDVTDLFNTAEGVLRTLKAETATNQEILAVLQLIHTIITLEMQ